jgi:hypothetical protein
MESAVAAAVALRPGYPDRARRAVRERIRSYLESEAVAPGAAAPVALFLLADLPVEEEELAALRASRDPLVRAPAEADPAVALSVLRPVIAPERPLGAREVLRIQVVAAMLRRCGAADADRVAFARSAIETDNATSRWRAIGALEGVSPEALEPLVPRLLLALAESSEMVRVAAAGLLAPREPAVRVLVLAIHDGRPWQVRQATAALGRAGVDAPPREASPEERRAWARAALRRREAE